MSVPPVSSSLQSPDSRRQVGFRAGTRCLDVWYYCPVLFFLPATSLGTLSRWQHLRLCLSSRKGRGPLSLPCWLKLFLRPKTSLRLRMSLHDFEVIIPCKTRSADPRPYPCLVDPAAITLILHPTPMDEASGVQGSLGTQYVSPVFGNYHIRLDKHILTPSGRKPNFTL